MRKVTTTAVALLLLIALCACNRVTRDWPIPSLSLPGGCTPAPFPTMFRSQDQGDFSDPNNCYPNENSSSWGKAFNCSLGWDALARDIDGKLRAVGYSDNNGPEMNPVKGVPGIDAKQLFRAWLAPDGKYKVALINFSYIRSKSTTSIDGADYALIIDLAKL
jgi:hypothetical protein